MKHYLAPADASNQPVAEFRVEAPASSLLGHLVVSLIEQRFPGAPCSLQTTALETPAIVATNLLNGRRLWVFPEGSDLSSQVVKQGVGKASLLTIGAKRDEVAAALDSLDSGPPIISSALQEQHRVDLPILTPRERDVAGLLLMGLSNAEIAHALSVSPHTVRTHLQSMCARFDVSSRGKLTAQIRRLQSQ